MVDVELRDYFAAAALKGLMAGPGMSEIGAVAKRYDVTPESALARAAYEQADAMLAERAR